MNEDDFVEGLRRRHAPGRGATGIGDDCCVWRADGEQCLGTDGVVEGVHFSPEDADDEVGGKAAGAALSDLAAMGAVPVGAVLAMQVGPGRRADALVDGCAAALAGYACPLLGGDSSAGPVTALTVTAWGAPGPAGRFVTRGGGGAGDVLAVTGALGGSRRAGRHLRPVPRLTEGAWLAGRFAVRALMDLSDGLAADAPRLARASGCGVELVVADLPVHDDAGDDADPRRAALADGEDFELLLAVAADGWEDLRRDWSFPVPLTRVGRLTAEAGCWLLDGAGRRPCPDWGYRHEL